MKKPRSVTPAAQLFDSLNIRTRWIAAGCWRRGGFECFGGRSGQADTLSIREDAQGDTTQAVA